MIACNKKNKSSFSVVPYDKLYLLIVWFSWGFWHVWCLLKCFFWSLDSCHLWHPCSMLVSYRTNSFGKIKGNIKLVFMHSNVVNVHQLLCDVQYEGRRACDSLTGHLSGPLAPKLPYGVHGIALNSLLIFK